MESRQFHLVLRYSTVNGYIAFTNVMACRVFRGVTLGMLEDNPTIWNMARVHAALETHAPDQARNPQDASHKTTPG